MDKTIFAVYGTLKKPYGNHYLLNGAKFLGTHVTNPNYTLFDGGFPVVERGGETAIHCELYETNNPSQIQRVFDLEGCSSQVQGHSSNWYDFDRIETPHGEAVMFVMDNGTSGRKSILNSGVWNR